MELLNKAKKFTSRFPPDQNKDQYFICDEYFINKLVDIAEVKKNDRVLEIGPGLGFITSVLAKRAKEVVAVEIDRRFAPPLGNLPANVEIIWGDAYELLNDKQFLKTIKPPTKVIAGIPYSQAQNMLHNYTSSDWYQGDLFWIAPLSLIDKVNKEHILSAYFRATLITKIPRQHFFPQPNTNSGIIRFEREPDPRITKNFDIYFRRWLHRHQGWKVKNALREGIINAAKDLLKIKVTKNQARELIRKLNLPEEILDQLVANLHPKYYSLINSSCPHILPSLY